MKSAEHTSAELTSHKHVWLRPDRVEVNRRWIAAAYFCWSLPHGV